MPCSCGSSECTCQSKCLCTEARCVCVSCYMNRKDLCQLCGLPFSHEDAVSQEGDIFFWCKCFLSEGLVSSGSDRSLSNRDGEFDKSTSNDFQDNKLPLAAVSHRLSHHNVEPGSAHAQSCNTETSKPFVVLDISDCRTSNRVTSNLPIVSLEKTELLLEQNELQKTSEFKSSNSSSRIPENSSSNMQNLRRLEFKSVSGSSSALNSQSHSNRESRTESDLNSQLHSNRKSRTAGDLNSQLHSNRAGRTAGNLFNSQLYSNRASKTAQASNPQLHSNRSSRNPGPLDSRSIIDASQKSNSLPSTGQISNSSASLPTDYNSNAQTRPPTRTAVATSTNNEWSSQRRRWCIVRTSQIRSPPLTYINPVLEPNMDHIRNWLDSRTNDSTSSSSSEESTANFEFPSKTKADQNIKPSEVHSTVVTSYESLSSSTSTETAANQEAAYAAANTVSKSCKGTSIHDKDSKDTSAITPDNLSTSLQELNTGEKTADADSTRKNSSSDELTSD